MKELSIIIVNYNTGNFLERCLMSLVKTGAFPQAWEVIVVDNHSADSDQSYIKQLVQRFPSVAIKTIFNDRNEGFAKANNRAVYQSKGRFILFLNPDTVVSVDAINIVVSCFAGHADVGAATCRVELANGQLDDACHRGFPTPWNALCHFSGIGKLFPHSMVFNGYHLGYRNMNTIHDIDACCGAFMMVRRSVGDYLHWFDEDYFWYGEDLDLCFRIRSKKFRIVYLPSVSIVHYKGVSSGIKNHSKEIATVNRATRLAATEARFGVMEIFYQKHYQKEYSAVVRYGVMAAIRLLKFATVNTI